MSRYRQFSFDSYAFESATGELSLHYSMDETLRFTERYRFDFTFETYDERALQRAIEALFFVAGVSYYKTFVPDEIVIKQGQLDETMAAFMRKTYQKGLGEFWYVNKLDPHTPVSIPATVRHQLEPIHVPGNGLLVGLGGGKDSLVSVELLRSKDLNIATWSLNHRSHMTPLVTHIGLPHYWVEREWDPQLFSLNEQGALNGHIPISAIFACVGTIVAILTGRRDVVVSNEQSANEETLSYRGASINHQYSKTQEFERDYQRYLRHIFGDSIRYYSVLRPFSELRIAELFAKSAFEKYQAVFSSCNRAFVHGSNHMSWCGECAKCAFVFLILSPFVPRHKLEALWGGKNLLLEPSLETTYRQLLGIVGEKPLDCIGEVKESRAAMRLTQEHYPSLKHLYQFELPATYDFRHMASDEMPPEIRKALTEAIRDLETSARHE